jgi:hypothetical protein
MLMRSVAVWFALLGVAILNGAFRELFLIPRIGPDMGHVISTLMLCALILVVTFVTISWIDPGDGTSAGRIGVLWVTLTVAFEFLGGHYLFHKPWSALIAEYDVVHGRIWTLVLFATALAPGLAAARRRLAT